MSTTRDREIAMDNLVIICTWLQAVALLSLCLTTFILLQAIFTVLLDHFYGYSLTRKGAFPATFLCALRRSPFATDSDDYHDWRLVRKNRYIINERRPTVNYYFGRHMICKRCGTEKDYSGLPPLSALEQLALTWEKNGE